MKRSLVIFFLFLLQKSWSQDNSFFEFAVELTNNGTGSVGLQFKDVSTKIGSGQTRTFKKKLSKRDSRFVLFVYLVDSNAKGGYRQHPIRIFSDSSFTRKLIIDAEKKIFFTSEPAEELVFQYHSNVARSNFWKLTDSMVAAHPDNNGSAEIILSQLCSSDYALERIEGSFQKLGQSVQKSSAGQSIARYIATRKNFQVGAQVSNFSLKDSSGKLVQLKDLSSEYILLDFWFSSCKPCMESFPRLVGLYSKFERSKLEIVGLSVDIKSKDWKSAIAKNNLPWINLHDRAQAVSYYTFAVENFPTQILLNSAREIVSINPTPDDIARLVQGE